MTTPPARDPPPIFGARRRWLAPGLEVGLYLGCYLVYLLTRGLLFDESVALLHAQRVISIEKSLGILVEPVGQGWLVDLGPGLLILFNWVYIIGRVANPLKRSGWS